ncbi:MAG: recombinase family protein, partial [Chloroflexota bacterium]
MQRYPIAYLRRSSADASDPGDVSREAQEAAVRELARRDGHNGELRTLTDWDRSADEAKESKRAGFLAMLAAIERGECEVVYAASLDRLYRSMRTFVRLTDAARAHDVRIVTLREGVLGGDGSPMAQAFAEIT